MPLSFLGLSFLFFCLTGSVHSETPSREVRIKRLHFPRPHFGSSKHSSTGDEAGMFWRASIGMEIKRHTFLFLKIYKNQEGYRTVMFIIQHRFFITFESCNVQITELCLKILWTVWQLSLIKLYVLGMVMILRRSRCLKVLLVFVPFFPNPLHQPRIACSSLTETIHLWLLCSPRKL